MDNHLKFAVCHLICSYVKVGDTLRRIHEALCMRDPRRFVPADQSTALRAKMQFYASEPLRIE
jgi:hypothetical protein